MKRAFLAPNGTQTIQKNLKQICTSFTPSAKNCMDEIYCGEIAGLPLHVRILRPGAMRTKYLHAFFAAAAMLGMSLIDGAYIHARADDCQADIANFNKKRQGAIEQLNALAKGGKKQLDPIAACPRLKNLVAIEHQLVAYLTKNKDWCNVPEEALANISASASKSVTLQTQACNVAAQVKKMQTQQASGLNAPQGQKLPTGPL